VNDDVGVCDKCVDGVAVRNVALLPAGRHRVKRPACHADDAIHRRIAIESRHGRRADLAAGPSDGDGQPHNVPA
jgi:hypothetical protein